jgi:hypothetical protein
MNMPGFTATASLGPSSITYTGAVGHGGWSRGAIVPAINSSCPGINCDATLASAILLFNPISWSIYQQCCMGGLRVSDACRNNPCLPECPQFLCICANQPCNPDCPPEWCPLSSQPAALSSSDAEFSDLSSQIATLRNDLKRQLNRIQRCACGPRKYNSFHQASSCLLSCLRSCLRFHLYHHLSVKVEKRKFEGPSVLNAFS